MGKAAFLGVVAVSFGLALGTPGAATATAKKKRSKSPAIAALTKDGAPNVQAAGAIVVDLDSGAELYAKAADEPRAIASTTKVFVAVVVRKKGLDLAGETTITDDDQARAQGGAKSRLWVGRRFKNLDLLRAMLIASDNRACTALGRAVGLSPEQLIDELNALAKELGLKRTTFTDTSGLRGNESTPRELAVALKTALADPLLAEIMTTTQVSISATDAGEDKAPVKRSKGKAKKKGPLTINYTNTNVSLREQRYEVIGGKTGYTDKARYCLVIAANIGGSRVAVALLGAEGELTRFADFNRVGQWLDQGGAKKARPRTATAQVGALADAPPAPVGRRLAR
jgi:D-alanyl-D-alanine endopeptidase (penicillin-binding protein 7)